MDRKTDAKHNGVLRKYDKSRQRSKSHFPEGDSKMEVDAPPIPQDEITRDLVPIPQPQGAEIKQQEPNYSILPSWQSSATKIGHSERILFSQLGLSDRMLSNLQSRDILGAFPVQSTVIPLLMAGRAAYRGDICVAAATGSGKTLAYVVPIIENLRRSPNSGLRAVIVVPTRELVKQVKDTCEFCAAGMDIKIVTALGSKSLPEEQKALVADEQVYDPEAYEKALHTPIDWAEFSLEEILTRAAATDSKKVENYVWRYRIKADLLITTPGRLVDHLDNTRGFHLDDVKWLVVDEADRLLNQSYQSWIDTVVPALQSTRATEDRDRILRCMRMTPPPRIVRKMLLSATMTRDISKLNHIGLDNPKLVVLESPSEDAATGRAPRSEDVDGEANSDASGKFNLPSLLQETVVSIKEGIDKPLVLLQLLEKHTGVLSTDSDSKPLTVIGPSSQQSHDRSSPGSDQSTSSSSSSDDSDSDSDSSSDDDSTDTHSTSSEVFDSKKRKAESDLTRVNGRKSTWDGSVTRTLIFTRSTESALRLSRLLSIISPHLEPKIATLTRGTNSSASSKKALSSFRSGRTPILIATDRASRGLDVPGLEHVISYDIPGSALTYVHRVGRTARAGKVGHAWTLVEHREGRWFSQEIGGKSKDCIIARDQNVKKMRLEVEDKDLKQKYDDALQKLGAEVRGD